MEESINLCSDCFKDEGLRLDSYRIGIESEGRCPNCNSIDGKKLNLDLINQLAYRFFVRGTVHKTEYGGAPVIQFNEYQSGNVLNVNDMLKQDIDLIEKAGKIGFFYYGPRMWMLGDVEPLKSLQSLTERKSVIDKIVREYPAVTLSMGQTFYRIRKNPSVPENNNEYDSPPNPGTGRLDSNPLSILYGSQDLEVCIHECRVSVEDNLYVASLSPTSNLKLLDLTALIQEDCTEFESLDIAVHMLFYAGSHSYDISRDIAKDVQAAGFDGIIYPSYFSTMRTGTVPFDTVRGISIRKFPLYTQYAKSNVIPNIALFGKPIQEGKISVKCINRLYLNRVEYDIFFGPVKY